MTVNMYITDRYSNIKVAVTVYKSSLMTMNMFQRKIKILETNWFDRQTGLLAREFSFNVKNALTIS